MRTAARLARCETRAGRGGGWRRDADGNYVPGPDLFPDLTDKLTVDEYRLLQAWHLLDAYFTRWMVTARLSEKERAWWAAQGVVQAADEDDLLAGIRIVLDDHAITLEGALLAAAPVQDRLITLLGGNPGTSAWVCRIYRTIHPECAALAHLEPIRPSVGCIGLPPRWWEAGA